MASNYFAILAILSQFLSIAYFVEPPSRDFFCEATPIEYDNTISLFCQETNFDQNNSSIDSKKSILFPNITQALKKVPFTSDDDEFATDEFGIGGEGRNLTRADVDPRNVSDLSFWARFDEIPDDAFARFVNLRQLHLAQYYEGNSKIAVIKDQAFRGLDKLEWLGLHLNLSQQPIPKSVVNLKNLLALALYEANLTSPFKIGPNQWPKLQRLTIYNSPNMSLAADAFKELLSTLNEIDFGSISIDEFPKSIIDLKNLTSLEIESTNLREIPPDVFAKSASSLQKIHLTRNRISILHPTSFRGLTVLTVLQLAFNEIEVIPASIFDDLTELQVLNLANNKIKTMPASIFQHNKNVLIFDLSENPIDATSSQFAKGIESSESTSESKDGKESKSDEKSESESSESGEAGKSGHKSKGSKESEKEDSESSNSQESKSNAKSVEASSSAQNETESASAEKGNSTESGEKTEENEGNSTMSKETEKEKQKNETRDDDQIEAHPKPAKITDEKSKSSGLKNSADFICVALVIIFALVGF